MSARDTRTSATAIGLPAAPVLEVRERFGPANVVFQALFVVCGLFVFVSISPPAGAFFGVAVALRIAWLLTHRRALVWDGHDLWLITGQSRKHATRGGAGEIRQIAVRRAGNPGNTVTRRYYVVVDEAGAATVRLPISQWDAAQLEALAAAAGIALIDLGLVPPSDAAILDPSPVDTTALAAFAVFFAAVAIAWFTQR